MKHCTTCNTDKQESDFYSRGKSNRLYSQCKDCHNNYCKKRWTDRKLRVVEQFGNKCNDCSVTYHPNVYEFHHVDSSTKDLEWVKMRLASEKRMQAELAKCVMLCANCHRLRHALSS